MSRRYVEVDAAEIPARTRLAAEAAAAFRRQLRSSQEIAVTAVRLAELDGLPPAAPANAEALFGRTTEFVTDLVEPAKAEALDKLGEGERALSVATGWLRTKLAPKAISAVNPVADK
jgi:hypothetical protein